LVVGLVGGIGSGKSRVALALARRGARIIRGDDLGHEALRQGKIKHHVVSEWGIELLDETGEVNRRKLGNIVFADPAQLRRLEQLVHPWIKDRIRQEVDAAAQDPAVRLIVLDAAIMLEAGWDGVCDRLVFVDCPTEERLRRLTEQRGWRAEEVPAREAAQLPLTEKRAKADDVVDNSATPEDLERQVDALLRRWGLDLAPAAVAPR
jgi:dephospho-CoA kinase